MAGVFYVRNFTITGEIDGLIDISDKFLIDWDSFVQELKDRYGYLKDCEGDTATLEVPLKDKYIKCAEVDVRDFNIEDNSVKPTLKASDIDPIEWFPYNPKLFKEVVKLYKLGYKDFLFIDSDKEPEEGFTSNASSYRIGYMCDGHICIPGEGYIDKVTNTSRYRPTFCKAILF